MFPRLWASFLALLLYRWEIIVRDGAIFGLIRVATLGFHVDAAIQELRVDRAVILLLAMGGLTLGIDTVSRALRSGLRLFTVPGGARRCPVTLRRGRNRIRRLRLTTSATGASVAGL